MKLYVLWDDGDGHKLLIPKDDWIEFFNKVSEFEKLISSNRKTDPEKSSEYTYELYDYLNSFDTLEGEAYYVVLPEDLEE